MKHLIRQIDGPSVLNNYNYRSHNWDSLSSEDKRAIWEDLIKMQGKLCAYCEKKIDHTRAERRAAVRHIEHFYRKNDYKELTFEWSNLFGSCGELNRCGFYKDKQKYDDNELIKADVHDPENYFIFFETGSIKVREGLSPQENKMAEVTLKVFNLNPEIGGVKAERRDAIHKSMTLINKYVELAAELIIDGEDEEEVRSMVAEDFYNEVKERCFITAIKHAFDNRLP
ncbi:retron Ec78 anti-phage system effector HNH endonuclease PtuB [Enterobacter bugandensis]|uniref:retron Ec78 anti-phage system effector HNH endonuclease PtuB n=1 Tax=Enterobacter bugandensis TaxID=881260 RepID=UPI002003786F|nr:retron Ec78 anti-phage system effector HNH endonuclease PtuB [Enterobacter bugandensis]MCK6760315.1 TIGR02646 family protein [Enterobacter bugandensis]